MTKSIWEEQKIKKWSNIISLHEERQSSVSRYKLPYLLLIQLLLHTPTHANNNPHTHTVIRATHYKRRHNVNHPSIVIYPLKMERRRLITDIGHLLFIILNNYCEDLQSWNVMWLLYQCWDWLYCHHHLHHHHHLCTTGGNHFNNVPTCLTWHKEGSSSCSWQPWW